MTPGSFYFDPDAEGLAVFLGPTEARLMELAWNRQSVTVKTALFLLDDSGLAYTTVMTVLNRLTGKGLLRREKDGRNFVYYPVADRQAFLRERVRRIEACLKRNFKVSPR